MKKFTLLTFVAVLTMALVGCDTTTETNSNKAVVVNDNANMKVNTNTNTATTSNTNSSKEVTREDFDKDKTRYEKEAKDAGSTIGQGANDMWLWTKVRSALLATDDLRESTVNVDVTNDVVTLRGTVGTQAQKDMAVKVAKDVEGVKDVKDSLKVDAKDSVTNMSSANANKTNANSK